MTQQIIPPKISKLEINISRLLDRCELLAKEDSFQNWRLEQYIYALEDTYKKLQASPDKPCKEKMTEYIKRIDFLKGVINTSKLSNSIERVVAAQMLPKTSTILIDSNSHNIATQIHQKTTAKYNHELRMELFSNKLDNGESKKTTNQVRQRLTKTTDPIDEQSLETLLKYNRNMQEKIAENMMLMTNSMKEHALTASAIIKKDMASLDQSDKLTETNTVKLKSESLKLEEHTKSNWRCWIWLMIAFVLIVFFNMVLFMRLVKKKSLDGN